MLVMMPSGTNFCIEESCGMHFWGVNSHDAMWHMEIAASSFSNYPFQAPTFSGQILSGYNILMDFIIYLLSLVKIPPSFTIFKLIPPIWFALFTLTAISLLRKINDKKYFVFLGLFFLYFAGHFGYILQFVHEGSIFKGSQSFGLQSPTMLLNTQFALTLPIIMTQLSILIGARFNKKNTLINTFLTCLSIALKFYGGVLSMLLLGFYFINGLFFNKEKVRFRALFTNATLSAFFIILTIIIVYNPFAISSQESVFKLSPFATVHAMIEEQDMVYMPNVVNARYFLYEKGWSPKLIAIELFSATLFIFFNFGVRFFSLIYFLIKLFRKKSSRFEIYLFISILVSTLLSVFLIQSGDWWNTVQFSYYGIFLSNFLLIIMLWDIIGKNKKAGLIVSIIIAFLSIPQVLQTVKTFTAKDTLYISQKEFEAMDYLKERKDGVIFSAFEAGEDYSFLDYKVSGYTTAFTGKKNYLAHLGPLKIIGIDYSRRLSRIQSQDCSLFDEVDYIYLVKEHSSEILDICSEDIKSKFKEGFENSEVFIYERI